MPWLSDSVVAASHPGVLDGDTMNTGGYHARLRGAAVWFGWLLALWPQVRRMRGLRGAEFTRATHLCMIVS